MESLRTKNCKVGRHAAMTAKPASIIDQYRIVETVTSNELVAFTVLKGENQRSGSTLVLRPAFIISNDTTTFTTAAIIELERLSKCSRLESLNLVTHTAPVAKIPMTINFLPMAI